MSRDEDIKSLRITDMTEKVEYCKTQKNITIMGKAIIKFGDFEIGKQFYSYKNPFFLNDVYIESKRISSSEENLNTSLVTFMIIKLNH